MGSEPAQGKMLAAALNFARHNIPVFPCGPDKRPRTKHGFKDATTDERQIQLWWTQWPDAMIGIPTGATSGIIVIDIDVDHEKGIDGTKWVVEVKHQHGDFPIGSRARTPRGGLHLYFKAPATQIRSSAGKIAEGVDVRAEGGYVIAPPSASSVGGYKWIKSIFEEGASGIPDFLLKILIEAHSSGQSSDLSDEQLIEEEIAAAVSDIRSAKDGTRNATLNRSAFKIGRLIGAGVCEEDDVRRRLQEAAEGAGLSPEEVCRTIESGVRAGKKRPWKPTSTDKVLNELNQNHFFALEGKNSFVFREDIDPLFRRATLTHLYPGAFRDAFRNVKVACGKTRSKSAGEAWLEWPQRRQYDKVVFAPGQEMGPSIYNTWQGHAVEAIKGDCSKFLEFIREIICGDDEVAYVYLMRWCAQAVQNPGSPGEVAIALRGGKGVGKSFFAEHVGQLFGDHFVQLASSHHLVGNFNAHLETAIFVFADEAFWAGDKQGESVLKTLVTAGRIRVERKGVDSKSVPNFIHLVLASNSDWVVPASADERRFLVLDVSQGQQQDQTYFQAIEAEWRAGGREAFMAMLEGLDLDGFNVRQAPQTNALMEQKLLSMRPVDRWYLGVLRDGKIDQKWPGWISTADLWRDYQDSCEGENTRPGTKESFGVSLRQLLPPCPGGGSWRCQRTIGASRLWGYNLPDLEHCRKHFERYIRASIVWDEPK